MSNIIKYIFIDLLKSKFIIFYTILLFLTTTGIFQFDTDVSKVILSLMNILLMIVPLVSLIFTSTHLYNSYEFIEVMLTQPINRKVIFFAEYIAISLALTISLIFGLGLPFLIYGFNEVTLFLLFTSIILTFVFVSLAFLSTFITRDKSKAIGITMILWLYFVLIYDSFILWFIYTFSDYPLEKATLGLISLNPIDLARMIMVLKLDISALLGYTGAFYKEFFGSSLGLIYSNLILVIWFIVPILFAYKVFRKKDF